MYFCGNLRFFLRDQRETMQWKIKDKSKKIKEFGNVGM